jgi:hypothetical protein
MVDKIISLGGLSSMIAKKVYASHAPSVQARGVAEHVHGVQLVELLLPKCSEHGLTLHLFDGEESVEISNIQDMAKHMSACDIEWLCIRERGADEDDSVFSVCLVYGNNADDPETGRGEMVADWGGESGQWYDMFDPLLDAFIDNQS